MAYKPAVLRASLYDYKEASYLFGFNLDKWLRQELINLGVIPQNAACCTTKNLFIKGGFVFTGVQEGGFNFNDYLKQVLGRLQVTTNNYCCPAKDISIDPSYIFYERYNLTGLQLINWIKTRLDFYGITYNDPCCVPNRLFLSLNSRIAAMGDSQTAYGNTYSGTNIAFSLNRGYLNWALGLTNGYFYLPPNGNAGFPGNTTAQMLARVSDVTSLNPSIVLDLSGTNDLGSGSAGIIERKQQLIDAYFAGGAKYVVLITIQPRFGTYKTPSTEADRLAVNDWIRSKASKNILVVDAETELNNPSYFSDGLHHNSIGAYKLGRLVASKVNPIMVSGLSIDNTLSLSNTFNANLLFTGTDGDKQNGATGSVVHGWRLDASDIGATVSGSVGTDPQGNNYQDIEITGTYTFAGIQSQGSVRFGELRFAGPYPSAGSTVESVYKYRILQNDPNLVTVTAGAGLSKADYSGKVYDVTSNAVYDEYDTNQLEVGKDYISRTPPAIGASGSPNVSDISSSLQIILKPQSQATPVSIKVRVYKIATRIVPQ